MNEALRNIRIEAENNIKAFFKDRKITELLLTDYDNPPIIIEDYNNSDLTYVALKISLHAECIIVECANTCDNTKVTTNSIDTDHLVTLAEWLENFTPIEEWEGMGDAQMYEVKKYVRIRLGIIFKDRGNCDDIVENIIDDVYADINATADWSGYEDDEINSDDVEIAIERVLTDIIYQHYND